MVVSASKTWLGSGSPSSSSGSVGAIDCFLTRDRRGAGAGAAAGAIESRPLRVWRRDVLETSGVYSTSSSTRTFVVLPISSSSSESITAARLVAARLDGLVDGVADMVCV